MQRLKQPFRLAMLFGWAIVISLYSVTPTFAKNTTPIPPSTRTGQEKLARIHIGNKTTTNELPRILRVKLFSPDGKELKMNLSPEARTKLITAIAKSLNETGNCNLASDEDGFGGCFYKCLRDAGVSPIQLVTCGTACALWETGVGIIVCAVCVGLDGTAVTFCATGCGFYAT